jgi:uncharacterized protein YbjT (DUF2867 family)
MTIHPNKTILVSGATGNQGGATVRHLLKAGWKVRALTRDATSDAAQKLAGQGVEVVQGDMGDQATLAAAFNDVYGAFSVQNTQTSGVEGEVTQGKNMADLAKQFNVQHFVYTSAMMGENTGVAHFDTKAQIEAYIKSLDIPYTILRPVGFMEVLTEKAFFPSMTAWHMQPRVMGEDLPQNWIATDDIGAVAAAIFADRDAYLGRTLALSADRKSIAECRRIYAEVMGKKPPKMPFPIWIFERFMAPDVVKMWRWLKDVGYEVDMAQTRAIIPDAMDLKTWLTKKRDGAIV